MGGGHEKPIYRRNCLKRGTWTVFRFKGGLAKTREGVFLSGREHYLREFFSTFFIHLVKTFLIRQAFKPTVTKKIFHRYENPRDIKRRP